MILDVIVKQKKIRLEQRMSEISVDEISERIKEADYSKRISFAEGIKKSGKLSIIAEVKKASPSKGVIREDFDPAVIAREYLAAGVDAMSVLTEEDFFLGRDEYIPKIKGFSNVPVLRKDFTVSKYQIFESRLLGADAVLLIASILTDQEIMDFQYVANSLALDCLVEVHDEEELERVLNLDVEIIGINNRNLKTFEVDLGTTEKLIKHIPKGKTVVSESGIRTHDDMVYLKNLGVDAVLIGETFMRSGSIVDKINEIRA